MGCILSSPAPIQEPVPEKLADPEPEKPAGPKPEKPKPLIFALMRNAHEVIRGAQRDLKQEIEKGDLPAARLLHEKLIKFTMMHMWMEEGSGTDKSPIGMFK
jgi:hypothetical protein